MFEKKEKKPKRIIVKAEQSIGIDAVRIIVDTQTGVNYLCTPGGVTPLLDSNGNVVVDNISEISEN